jgi:glycerate 2-kinase
MAIRNRAQLTSVGDSAARRRLLDIAEDALTAMDSYPVIRDLFVLERNALRIGARSWDLGPARRVFVVGAGKAANAMARAVEDALGKRITTGIVIAKVFEPTDRLQRIELLPGGHPLPNEAGLAASRRILELVDQARPEDLFISLISGGSSALMSCPILSITLEEERVVTEALLKSSARILEINAVRRHISATNGGRLAERIQARGAELINLIISDGVGKPPTVDPARPAEFFGTPVAPDGTTLSDARAALDRYRLWDRIPRSIAEFLRTADAAKETPKRFGGRVQHFVLQEPADACEAAKKAAEARGIPGLILTTQLEGESREAGTFLGCLAKEVALTGRPLPAPCVLIAGGETTTRVEGEAGLGGPSQELALAFGMELAGRGGVCLAALDTDGTDGPTDIAGGLTDGTTVERARQAGLEVYESLRSHDSSKVLCAVGDAVITGNTGTNVCDLNVLYVAGAH